MRRHFSSYGPVNSTEHFVAPRPWLVERFAERLLGDPALGGAFFILRAPRQTGKTWLMRQALQKIRARHGDRYTVFTLTLGALMKDGEPDEVFLQRVPRRFKEALGISVSPLSSFSDWPTLFARRGGLFDRPVILLIDEVDGLTPSTLVRLVALFRQMLLTREAYHLHALGLIGVRAALGMDRERGSPFLVERIPNLTYDEVAGLFAQYEAQSGQTVEDVVVRRLYAVTRGQPGLVGFFGELVTDKYNPGALAPITLTHWETAYCGACRVEPNNTVLHVLKRARDPRFLHRVADLFQTSPVPFRLEEDWCNHLYLEGVLDDEQMATPTGKMLPVCRFSSPFIQERLFCAFAQDVKALASRVPVIDPRDDLTEVFAALDLPALLGRYRDYLQRARAQGQPAGHGPPACADLGEAVGHFHLYWWLKEAAGRALRIAPEFPGGTGLVLLHLRTREKAGMMKVKRLTQRSDLPDQRRQAARLAYERGLASATLVLFVPKDGELVAGLSNEEEPVLVDGQPVRVIIVAIPRS